MILNYLANNTYSVIRQSISQILLLLIIQVMHVCIICLLYRNI